jgi:hypothetical protein
MPESDKDCYARVAAATDENVRFVVDRVVDAHRGMPVDAGARFDAP